MRRFTTEFGLNVTVAVKFMGQQRDFEQLPNPSPGCNIYLVSRQPRITIDPRSVQFGEGFMSATATIHRGPRSEEIPILTRTEDLGCGPFRWHSEWPYDRYEIHNNDGEPIAKGIVALALLHFDMIKDTRILAHEVIYVGQAFGKDGERTAYDRIRSHSTLQRIYAESRPDQVIWLHFCEVGDVTLFSEIDPTSSSETDDKRDDRHVSEVYQRVASGAFRDREAVALAEAGLIGYFKPAYNEKFKNTYPDPKHVHIETCYDLDFAAVTVELQGYEVRADYYSKAGMEPSPLHFASFALRGYRGALIEIQDVPSMLWPEH